MSKRENGIYVTHGKEMLVGYKALVTLPLVKDTTTSSIRPQLRRLFQTEMKLPAQVMQQLSLQNLAKKKPQKSGSISWT